MADRRMFAKTIIDSDAFLDMPLSTQALYFHLSMRADDEGFVNNPKKIQRMVCASDDDLKVLIAKNFIIPFESGIVVIKHWRIHNYIQNDRFKPTVYADERAMLEVKDNKAYTLKTTTGANTDTRCIQDVSSSDTQLGDININRVNSISEGKETAKRFTRPTFEEVEQYCFERKNKVNAQRFLDYYDSNGWKVGRNPMKDWKAAVRNWERDDKAKRAEAAKKPMDERPVTDDDFAWNPMELMNRPRREG